MWSAVRGMDENPSPSVYFSIYLTRGSWSVKYKKDVGMDIERKIPTSDIGPDRN